MNPGDRTSRDQLSVDRVQAPKPGPDQRRAAALTLARSALRTGASKTELVQALAEMGLLPNQESEWN